MLKAELRREFLGRQQALSPTSRSDHSGRIADLFFKTFPLSNIRYLHCFISIDRFSEIDTTPIFQRIWAEYRDFIVLVPKIDPGKGEIENLKFTSDTKLVQNPWGIHEPEHDEFVEAEKIDLVIVPLVCFDRAGFRVGYGKGYYDKLLARCRSDCLKIGLSYFAPVERIDDLHEHDFRLNACVTSDGVFHFE